MGNSGSADWSNDNTLSGQKKRRGGRDNKYIDSRGSFGGEAFNLLKQYKEELDEETRSPDFDAK